MHQRQGERDKGPWWCLGDLPGADVDGRDAVVGEGEAGLVDHVDAEPLVGVDKH